MFKNCKYRSGHNVLFILYHNKRITILLTINCLLTHNLTVQNDILLYYTLYRFEIQNSDVQNMSHLVDIQFFIAQNI